MGPFCRNTEPLADYPTALLAPFVSSACSFPRLRDGNYKTRASRAPSIANCTIADCTIAQSMAAQSRSFTVTIGIPANYSRNDETCFTLAHGYVITIYVFIRHVLTCRDMRLLDFL